MSIKDKIKTISLATTYPAHISYKRDFARHSLASLLRIFALYRTTASALRIISELVPNQKEQLL
ncbi:MAG: hypothetical protein Q8R55_04350 [Candidatus Taylorbacteria bacterium]|nr:hypothetical protein [Candidatus Taylorbacteria bacterium]